MFMSTPWTIKCFFIYVHIFTSDTPPHITTISVIITNKMVYYFFTVIHPKRAIHSLIINTVKNNNNTAQTGSILIMLTSP